MKKIISATLAASAVALANAAVVANFPMDVSSGSVSETVGNRRFSIEGNIGAMSIPSPSGTAWRTDGYTSFINAQVGNIVDGNQMTAKIAFAIDTNSIISADNFDANNRWANVVDCIDEGQRSGFAFMLGRTGKFAFRTYVGGTEVILQGDELLDLWQWHELAGVVDGNKVRLYLNGRLVKEQTVGGSGVKVRDHRLLIGRDPYNNDTWALARTGDFNGAIDYITVSNDAAVPSYNSTYADLNLPADRYAKDNLRAKFHGQPGMNWTNETHGLFYNAEDGKYHVFFQRTGSAPVMSHAHWGHIVSDNLYDWCDEKPAIWPTESFDLRGCWSGCVFADQQISGGKPAILYTGVGYGGGESYSAMAICEDTKNMRKWKKQSNYIARYDNTQRDTYFFRTDANNAYFVIGDDGYLRQYKWNGNGWSDHGSFYNFRDGESGFTEMPNISKLPNGKWLMTFTPWSSDGVVCTYRIGDIDSNGKFCNFTSREKFDFFARDGFGLMSPTIGTAKDGSLLALGIVADKMPTEWNISHGYAHLYSLPRTLYTDAQGRLCQKPFANHTAMRGNVSYKLDKATELNGTLAVNPVRGRQAEVCATFTVSDSPFGIRFLENGNGKGGVITYYPGSHEIKLDVSAIVGGDYGVKDASFTLPVYPQKGEEFKMHLFIDHSIADLFVNDRYAASFRVFPDNMEHDLIQVFSNGKTTLTGLEAYMVKDGHCNGQAITPPEPVVPEVPESSGKVAIYVAYDNEAQLAANLQEKRAVELFRSQFPSGSVIYNNPSAVKASSYDCIWMHIERDNLQQGWTNLPAEANNSQLIAALRQYVADGGNLYLSKHAAQLAVAIGRTDVHPTEFGNTDPGAVCTRNDIWQTNIFANGTDWSVHPIFSDLMYEEPGYGKVINLLGLTTKHYDRNVMWKLNDNGGHDNFCANNNARVLGTWGHDGGQAWGGIIEFMPSDNMKRAISADKVNKRKGTVIVNGLAAYHLAPLDGTVNPYQDNIDKLTSNIICYLSPKTDVSTVIEDCFSVTAENVRWFTLQGVEVIEPSTPGVYIKIANSKSTKVMVR